jgi:hypothetical protein
MLFCWNPWILSYCFQHLTCQITEKRDFVWLRHRGKVTPTPYGKIGGIHGSSSHLHLKIPPGLKDLREKQLAFCGIVNFQVCPIDFPNTKPVPLTKPIYIYTIYIDMLHMYVWLYMLYSICYILPMSHHVIPDCIPMSYPWHEAARRGAARLAARWPQKRRCNVHCCAVIQIPKRRCGDVAIFLGIFTLKSWATAGRSREIGETSPCPRLGQSALGGSRAQLDFPSGFHHQSSTMLSISMVPREGPWFSHSYNYGIIWVMWKIYID